MQVCISGHCPIYLRKISINTSTLQIDFVHCRRFIQVTLKLQRKNTTSPLYRVFSHDVTAAMLVSQTNPLGVELFSYANAFFCFNKFA